MVQGVWVFAVWLALILLVSIVVGFIASLITGERTNVFRNMALGFGGSVLGSLIAWLLNIDINNWLAAIFFAVLGAVIIIFLDRAILGRRTNRYQA